MSNSTLRRKEGFLVRIFNHYRLSWNLLWDRRVSIWPKLFLIVVPIVYAVIPLPDDFLPFGLLDDIGLIGIFTVIFNSICPRNIADEHRRRLRRLPPQGGVDLEMYRHPKEIRHLAIGFTFSIVLLALGGYPVGFTALLLFGIGYVVTAIERNIMLSNAVQVTEHQLVHLNSSLREVQRHLPPVQINLFVTQNPHLNALTFGYEEPYSIVLTSALVEKSNEREIQAVIGHEIGHILFEHVRLVNLAGLGSGLLRLLFYQWNRSGEYSADAIALLASGGDLAPVVSMMLKLSSGLGDVNIDLDAFLTQASQASERVVAFTETFNTHPFISNRIQRLIEISRLPS